MEQTISRRMTLADDVSLEEIAERCEHYTGCR